MIENAYLTTEFGLSGPWLAEYMLESLNAGVLVHDVEGKVTAWNPRAHMVFACSDEVMMGSDCCDERWDLIRPDGSALPREEHPVIRSLNERDSIRDVVIGLLRGDRQRVWLQVSALPIFGPDSSVRAVLSTQHDVTDVIASQSRLQASEYRFGKAFENDIAGNLVVEFNGRIVAWNSRFSELVGRTDGEMFDLNLADLAVLDLDEVVAMLLDEGAVRDFVEGATNLIRRDDEERHVDARIQLIEWPNHSDCALVQVVTEAPEASDARHHDAWYRKAFDDSMVATLVTNSAQLVVEGNAAAARLLGRQLEDLPGSSLPSFVDLRSGRLEDTCDRILLDGEPMTFPDAVLHTDQGIRDVCLRIASVADGDSSLIVQLTPVNVTAGAMS